MGFYQVAKNKTSARKKAQKRKSKKVVITSVRSTRNKGQFYINTRRKRI